MTPRLPTCRCWAARGGARCVSWIGVLRHLLRATQGAALYVTPLQWGADQNSSLHALVRCQTYTSHAASWHALVHVRPQPYPLREPG